MTVLQLHLFAVIQVFAFAQLDPPRCWLFWLIGLLIVTACLWALSGESRYSLYKINFCQPTQQNAFFRSLQEIPAHRYHHHYLRHVVQQCIPTWFMILTSRKARGQEHLPGEQLHRCLLGYPGKDVYHVRELNDSGIKSKQKISSSSSSLPCRRPVNAPGSPAQSSPLRQRPRT